MSRVGPVGAVLVVLVVLLAFVLKGILSFRVWVYCSTQWSSSSAWGRAARRATEGRASRESSERVVKGAVAECGLNGWRGERLQVRFAASPSTDFLPPPRHTRRLIRRRPDGSLVSAIGRNPIECDTAARSVRTKRNDDLAQYLASACISLLRAYKSCISSWERTSASCWATPFPMASRWATRRASRRCAAAAAGVRSPAAALLQPAGPWRAGARAAVCLQLAPPRSASRRAAFGLPPLGSRLVP